jgi:hypothetical protein
MPAQAKGWRTPKRYVKRVVIDAMVDMVVSLEPGVNLLKTNGQPTSLEAIGTTLFSYVRPDALN